MIYNKFHYTLFRCSPTSESYSWKIKTQMKHIVSRAIHIIDKVLYTFIFSNDEKHPIEYLGNAMRAREGCIRPHAQNSTTVRGNRMNFNHCF